jgi:hypothetical protein
MPLVEPQQFKRDDGVIITCAQPIDSEKFAEIIEAFLQEISEWTDDPEAENLGLQRTAFSKSSREIPTRDVAPGQGWMND